MKLHFTPRSHFSRKVRILLDAWNADVTLVDAGNVADASAEAFGPNPLMKVPTLIDGGRVILDSDHIARYLARKLDPEDSFGVATEDVDLLNARSVMNGAMAAEVELLLARRTGIDTGAYRRFDKILESIRQGLAWLEAHAGLFSRSPEEGSYAGFHLVCLWDHLALFEIVPLEYPALREKVARLSALPYVARSAPR